jgi:hypothetical protein
MHTGDATAVAGRVGAVDVDVDRATGIDVCRRLAAPGAGLGHIQVVVRSERKAGRANIYLCPYETAAAYLSLGGEASRTKAIELLYEAVDKRSNCLIFLRNDPRMRTLREDPHHAGRFKELLTLVGLDEAAVRSYKK